MSAAAVLYAWELGGGLGHVAKGLRLATELRQADLEVSFAVRDLAGTHPLLPDAQYRLYQAPVAWARPRDAPEPASYAELLLHAGFGDPATLAGLVRGWQTLFEVDATRLVIADHAPGAVLAARCAGLPAIAFGHGFFAPPAPWPVFRTWDPPSVDRRAGAERRVLDVMNDCLARHGVAPWRHAAELYAGAERFLCTVPELDHYPDRATGDAVHLGTLWVDDVGLPPAWPAPGAPGLRRVFAYLRPELPGFAAVLEALDRSGASVLVASPGLAAETVARHTRPRLAFARQLVRLGDVAREADLVVCSGSDTLHGLAQAGVPVLGLPMNAEQRIAAERVAVAGAGRWVLPGASAETLLDLMNDLLGDPACREAAHRLQQRSAAFAGSVAARLAPVVAACRRAIAGGARSDPAG